MKKRCKWYNVCPMRYYYERGLLDEKWIKKYCFGDNLSCKRYQAEENGIYHEDWMLPDGTLDENLKWK
jgi:hypothetical protein